MNTQVDEQVIVLTELPAGYENATHIIVVSDGDFNPRQYSASVLRVIAKDPSRNPYTEEVEEVGIGPLSGILAEAAKVIRRERK